MQLQFHVDGELVPAERARVGVRDRGFRYGDAVFETMRAYGGTVFDWAAHAERLTRTRERLGLTAGPGAGTLRDRLRATLEANDLQEAYVRLTVSRGEQPGTLTPRPAPDPTVVVEVRPLPRGGPDGEPVWDGPATLQTVRTRAIPDDCLPADGKTANYLNGVLARLELRRMAGGGEPADEALVRDLAGNLVGGAASNLLFVDEEGLHTPTTEGPALPGVTRRHVLELAREEDLPVHEGTYDRDDLREADEVALTNSTWEVRPVATVDGVAAGDGPVVDLLAARFRERVAARHYRD